MKFVKWVWDHAKAVIIVVVVGAVLVLFGMATVLGVALAIAILAAAGVVVTWIYIAMLSLLNGDGDPLPDITKRIMRNAFDADVVEGARLVQHATGLAGVGATTVGLTIYWKGAYVECGNNSGTCLMAHELVHVRQYIETNDVLFTTWYGIQAALALEHDPISYEQEAIAFEEEHCGLLLDSMWRECASIGAHDASDLEWLVLLT